MEHKPGRCKMRKTLMMKKRIRKGTRQSFPILGGGEQCPGQLSAPLPHRGHIRGK